MVRLFVSLFGGLFLLCVLVLVRQLAAEHLKAGARSRTLRASPEGWFLLAAVVTLAFRYCSDLVSVAQMPGIGSRWIWGYGLCCAIYLAVKAIRMVFVKPQEVYPCKVG